MRRNTLTCLVLLVTLALGTSDASAQSGRYNILITNDDGVQSPGITELAEHLARVGNVTVVAPCGQQSGASMSVALRDELHVRTISEGDDLSIYCVDTSPAGSAMLGILNLAPEGGFDLVVSGINIGANVGTASHMSGTMGGAMMGAFYNIPAIAVSFGARSRDLSYPAAWTAGFVRELKRHDPMPGIAFSINIPRASEAETEGVIVTKMGGIHLRFAYEEVADSSDVRTFQPRISLETQYPPDSDTEAFMNGMITVAPLQFDWTAYGVIDEVRAWGLTRETGENR